MQVFEFHFNPKIKPDLLFDSFCYEPGNNSERKLGSLYITGLLKNSLPKNLHFLEKTAKIIKEKYYHSTKFSPEKALKQSLKDANEFLEQIAKKGDVSWLGNLSFSVLSLKDFRLNFTKVGEMKTFLLRGGEAMDIDKNLKFQDIEPYPLKIFGNIVAGKLAENDLILVLTKEVADFFKNQNLLDKIAKLIPFSEKRLKEIINEKKEDLAKISGICLVIYLTKETQSGRKQTFSPKMTERFSLKEVFRPFLNLFRFKKPKVNLTLKERFKVSKLPKIKIPKIPLGKFQEKIKNIFLNKKLILILLLILILILGFIFSRMEENKKMKVFENNLKEIQGKLNLAESYLILDNSPSLKKANSLLKESFEIISPISKESESLPKSFSQKVFALRDEILGKLYDLNNFEEIKDPKLIFEFKAESFIPQKILAAKNGVFFFSPYAKNLFFLKDDGNGESINTEEKFNLGTEFNDLNLFFAKSNHLAILNGKNFSSFSLTQPYPDFNFDDFASYKGNLYFLDKKAGQIVRYSYLGKSEWSKSEIWLNKITNPKSIAVDGSVWVLKQDNSLERYYAGNLQEKINSDIFPLPENFSKIFTAPFLPYLYLLEPSQKRIVILDKSGKVIKQFQSENFDSLLDFGVSPDGKEIFLLNGLKVYKIDFLP